MRLLKTILLTCFTAAALSAQSPLTVLNGARFEVQYPLAPGAYAQAYGLLEGVPTMLASSVPLPMELDGVRVLVNDVASPLLGIDRLVVSFLIPRATQPGRRTVKVVRGGATLGQGTVDIVAVSPGLFYVLTDPLAQGGVINEQNQFITPDTPARRGQAIQIFGTGQGSIDIGGEVPDNGVPPEGKLASATRPTEVYISVEKAQVLFSGLSPQFPGLWQINAIVPDKPYVRGRVPLTVTIDGVPSNQVSFWVAE